MHHVKIVFVLMFVISQRAIGQDIATQAAGVLRTYCYECHGKQHQGSDENYDVTNLAYLRAANYTVPGNPGASKIMRKISAGKMPPPGSPKPSAAEVNILEQWIQAGAKDPSKVLLGETPDQYVLRHILADINANVAGESRNFRYVAFTNIPAASLAQYHAALSKALNSLTFKQNISFPTSIDDNGYVLRIDQRDYGWNDAQWNRVLAAYPYFESPAYVRGDWFISNALKPPIYYDLLGLPNNERALEQLVGIDTRSNIRAARAVRAGVLNSGVAVHNRVVERHASRFGTYWKSYDFASSDDRQNILRFPLGPRGTGFDNQAFEEDATEIIFSLPNGLHGYFVADKNGNRLNEVDPKIAFNRKPTSGDLLIRPGLDCMACHAQGIQDKFVDVVRLGTRFNGDAGNRIRSLYVDSDRMKLFTNFDKQQYLKAVQIVTGDTAEPVGEVALKYQEPVDLAHATQEVGATSSAQITTAVAVDARLRALVLPLVRGGTIPRAQWESKELGQSPAERLADLLRN